MTASKSSCVGATDDERRSSIGGNGIRGRSSDAVFRLKLWWNHLPSPGVLKRGTPTVDAEEKCEYCACRGRMTTCHLLAVFQAPALKETRKRVGEKLRRLGRKIADGTSNTTMRTRLEEAFTMTASGHWIPPQAWMSEAGNKAGNAALSLIHI